MILLNKYSRETISFDQIKESNSDIEDGKDCNEEILCIELGDEYRWSIL